MKFIPQKLLKNLYTRGSLRKVENGIIFKVKNRLASASITGLEELAINGNAVSLKDVSAHVNGDQHLSALELNEGNLISFPLAKSLELKVISENVVEDNQLDIELTFITRPFGKLKLTFSDHLSGREKTDYRCAIPRSEGIEDFSENSVHKRQQYLAGKTGLDCPALFELSTANLERFSGNIENLVGLAGIPVGIAGPLKIQGSKANGEYYIPMATTEGALVASYNKGMKLLNEAGGVRCQVTEDQMQRAPVFIFRDMKTAAIFTSWFDLHLDKIKQNAEEGSNHTRLKKVETYPMGKLVFLRFNFYTGDAAGQNMVNKAVFQACNWILENFNSIEGFYLEANMASDKKFSFLNQINPRGKRVTAEVTVAGELLERHMGVKPEQLVKHWSVASVGGQLAGVNNNGLQSANGLAAMFIATGQDLGNMAESTVGISYSEVTANGELYGSFTLPSLIVATVGGGTGLPTQRECLEIMGCYGNGNAIKLAEIMAGVVAAGEISLASAISSMDWVSAHEQLGRN
jgi:hydroxymethylglutaryl-CoA reductase (NADPH)